MIQTQDNSKNIRLLICSIFIINLFHCFMDKLKVILRLILILFCQINNITIKICASNYKKLNHFTKKKKKI